MQSGTSPYAAEPWVPYAPRNPEGLFVYRLIKPVDIDFDRTLADGPYASSGSFQDYTAEKAAELGYPAPAMSIGIGERHELAEDPLRMLHALADKSYGLVRMRLAAVYQIDPPVGIVLDPRDDAPWHGMIFATDRLRFTKGQKNKLRECVDQWEYIPLSPNADR